ncbi:MAG: hypothetical protein B7Y90_10080 [Alphaproteobacteria bacterium 32-64-14]|nr:MAG: hypothetical protein B7Y90_10080 [Alphaproteobacteria bacterium 32-64-14]
MRYRDLALASVVAMMAPVAMAQKIPSAEAGVAPLAFDAFAAPAPSVTVAPGGVAWIEQIIPVYAVRLIDPAKQRPRPSTDGLPAGALLFGYQLSTGMAYCPPLNPEKSFKRVQCFRDLDNDMKFDAGYVSDGHDADNRYFSSFLRTIAAVPKYRYERVSGDLMPTAKGSVIYHDMKDGAPRFKLRIDNETLENVHACDVTAPGACTIFGVHIRYEAAPQGALAITFDGALTQRALDILNARDPLKT